MNGHLDHKLALDGFWSRFGGKKSDGLRFSNRDKLAALIEMSNVVISYQNQQSSELRRESFNETKATLHKFHIRRNSVCFSCGGKPYCRHHIIQLQHGGINSRKNIVSLCGVCHALIHPWLQEDAQVRQSVS